MIIIPFQVGPLEYNVFVALQDENLERMKAYDPAQLEPRKLGHPWDFMRLNVVLIGYATEADIAEIQDLAARGRGAEIPKRLSRGFKFRPEAGDYDGHYLRTNDRSKQS